MSPFLVPVYWINHNLYGYEQLLLFLQTNLKHIDKVPMYEEIMTNDDNLESNLLTSSLLKKTSGLHAGTK